MTTDVEYALLAGVSYISNRADINKFPVPQGWLKINNPDSYFIDPATGFEAISYVKGNDIVISYAGTDFSLPLTDFSQANIPLALGNMSDQLKQAAEYYLQIKASAPIGANISFTGHSLGGGLAALIAVMFNEPAVTFDQAPFRSATVDAHLKLTR